MFRWILGILISLIAVTFLRTVMGILSKEVKDAVSPNDSKQAPKRPDAASKEAAAVMLRKCSLCGTFRPESAMRKHHAPEGDTFVCAAGCEKA